MSMILCIALSLLLMGQGGGLSFEAADKAFAREGDYAKSRNLLLEMLPQAKTPAEKAEVCWRLARAQMLLGENVTDKEGKRKHFTEGIAYADQAIAADPSNHNGYMWHCACVGRDCQTRSLKEQAASVPVMTNDLTTILEKLGRTDCSEAWQALSEIYWHHPFKSNDKAVEYARKALQTIPKGELRVPTYTWLASILYERNKKGDREEARQLLARVRKKYEALADPEPAERKAFKELPALENKMK